eukprot:GHVU01054519.1.p1 GENE.GHVU01054519.1~~GHVU01054519.1.p1  ORF type:complete len:118 (-),score=6.28 GHVU01054519.1:79-432(-)
MMEPPVRTYLLVYHEPLLIDYAGKDAELAALSSTFLQTSAKDNYLNYLVIHDMQHFCLGLSELYVPVVYALLFSLSLSLSLSLCAGDTILDASHKQSSMQGAQLRCQVDPHCTFLNL